MKVGSTLTFFNFLSNDIDEVNLKNLIILRRMNDIY